VRFFPQPEIKSIMSLREDLKKRNEKITGWQRGVEDQFDSPVQAKSTAHVLVGTSGWMYDSWRGPLYPTALPKQAWLSYYATRFSTVEINSAFYRTPSLETVRSWCNDVARDFRFAWKASKFITHWKRLTDKCENSIALMQTRLKVLFARPWAERPL
jgi:Protein of unknown function DUF72